MRVSWALRNQDSAHLDLTGLGGGSNDAGGAELLVVLHLVHMYGNLERRVLARADEMGESALLRFRRQKERV